MGLLEEGENLKLKDNDFVVPCVNSGVLLKTMPFLFMRSQMDSNYIFTLLCSWFVFLVAS